MRIKQTAKEPKVVTTVHIPMELHKEMESFKGKYGVPHARTICRGIELAMKEVAPELKRFGALAGA